MFGAGRFRWLCCIFVPSFLRLALAPRHKCCAICNVKCTSNQGNMASVFNLSNPCSRPHTGQHSAVSIVQRPCRLVRPTSREHRRHGFGTTLEQIDSGRTCRHAILAAAAAKNGVSEVSEAMSQQQQELVQKLLETSTGNDAAWARSAAEFPESVQIRFLMQRYGSAAEPLLQQQASTVQKTAKHLS